MAWSDFKPDSDRGDATAEQQLIRERLARVLGRARAAGDDDSGEHSRD